MLENEARHPVSSGEPPDDKIKLSEAQLLKEHCVFTRYDLDTAPRLFFQKEIHGTRHDGA
ncbi:hypothetical protein D3C72_2479080 [compost metagenome]